MPCPVISNLALLPLLAVSSAYGALLHYPRQSNATALIPTATGSTLISLVSFGIHGLPSSIFVLPSQTEAPLSRDSTSVALNSKRVSPSSSGRYSSSEAHCSALFDPLLSGPAPSLSRSLSMLSNHAPFSSTETPIKTTRTATTEDSQPTALGSNFSVRLSLTAPTVSPSTSLIETTSVKRTKNPSLKGGAPSSANGSATYTPLSIKAADGSDRLTGMSNQSLFE